MSFSDSGFDSDRLALLQKVYDALCAANVDVPREEVAAAVLSASRNQELYEDILERASLAIGVGRESSDLNRPTSL